MTDISILERNFPGRRAQLKREILQRALQCFNEHGVDATTIDMIRAQCDTSVGAIYHHFGNKDGLVAALFFTALEDQQQLRQRYLEHADSLRGVVLAQVYSYVDWVEAQPEWARFQYQAYSLVSKGPHRKELIRRNVERSDQLKQWFAQCGYVQLENLPTELRVALTFGSAENYCRQWLSGRAKTPPTAYRELLAEAAWRALNI